MITSDFVSIKHAWDLYCDEVIPPGTSPQVVEDMKTTFYTGAIAVMTILNTKVFSNESASEADAVVTIVGINNELEAFHDSFVGG